MIIQFILSFVFLVLFLYGYSHKNRSRSVGGLIYACAGLGCFLVWFPEYSGDVAHLVGVGRGADLVLYLFVVISLVAGFSLYLKLNACMSLVTDLARHIALSTPNYPDARAGDKAHCEGPQ